MNKHIKEFKELQQEKQTFEEQLNKKYSSLKSNLEKELNEEYKSNEVILSEKPLCYTLTISQIMDNGGKLTAEFNSKLYQIRDFLIYFDRYKDKDFVKHWKASRKSGYYCTFDDKGKAKMLNPNHSSFNFKSIYVNNTMIKAVNKVFDIK